MLRKKYSFIIPICYILSLASHTTTYAQTADVVITKPEQTIKINLPLDDAQIHRQVALIKYDAAIYDTAYKIFLQNNNIKNAYAVAVAAVQQNPNSILWKKRLVQVAIWNDQPLTALREYLDIARMTKDKEAITAGIKLAKSMYEDQILSELMLLNIATGDNSENNWQAYINAMLRMGELREAIATLDANEKNLSPAFYLLQTANIYRMLDEPQQELKALTKYTATIKIDTAIVRRQAETYLSQGDIKSTFKLLQNASTQASDDDFQFWYSYAVVAALLDKNQEAIHAYQKLTKQEKPHKEIYIHLIELNLPTNLKAGYDYSVQGKKLFPESFMLTKYALSLAIQTKKFADLPQLLTTIPASLMQQLDTDPVFPTIKAYYWQQLGNHDKALQMYHEGLERFPQSAVLKAEYLDFLVQSKDTSTLAYAIKLWPKEVSTIPRLSASYETARTLLQNRGYQISNND